MVLKSSPMLIPVKDLGHLATKSLHLEALSWKAGGKASVLTTQERENRAPTCHRKNYTPTHTHTDSSACHFHESVSLCHVLVCFVMQNNKLVDLQFICECYLSA